MKFQKMKQTIKKAISKQNDKKFVSLRRIVNNHVFVAYRDLTCKYKKYVIRRGCIDINAKRPKFKFTSDPLLIINDKKETKLFLKTLNLTN